MDMYRGNFDIEDYVSERMPLAHAVVTEASDGYEIAFSGHEHDEPRSRVHAGQGCAIRRDRLHVRAIRPSTGSGFALWRSRTSMSGAAASRCRISTCAAVVSRSGRPSLASAATRPRRSPSRPTSTGKAGGDYWNTNYPQPTYLSSRRYALHVETTGLCGVRFPTGRLP